jgi:hypothetical protein
MIRLPFYILTFLVTAFAATAQNQFARDFRLIAGFEERFFPKSGLYSGQKQNYLSVSLQPEFELSWNEKKHTIRGTFFGRYDQHDQRRTHADIRELYWQTVKGNHEISAGIKKIFWGVTESAHLVNIINQTDVVESFDGEEKLGQPMVHYSYGSNAGTFDFFYLPYFRKPTFPGRNGRLRTPFLIYAETFSFESKMEEFRPDVAFRWSHYFGKFDIGVSHFYGTSRQPLLGDLKSFQPVFAIVNQTGLEVQATTGPVLWKLEFIHNVNDILDFFGLATGFEHTFGNVNGKGLDIGILAEYLYDSRGNLSFNSQQHDVFIGSRIAFNNTSDTQILAGALVDVKYNAQAASIEASQRVGESWKVYLEGRYMINTSSREFMHFIRNDSFVRLAVNKYF